MYGEILRYMGHSSSLSGETGTQLEALISLCLEKLSAVSNPRHVIRQFPCSITGENVTIGTLNIKSVELAALLDNCSQAYLFAATLGADVDRLISQLFLTSSAEALCLQACAATKIEDYCDNIESEITRNLYKSGLFLRPRFSPGYGDFDITFQPEILNILNAHKLIGLTVTEANMLVPLKSVTAVIGISSTAAECKKGKCENCGNADCGFRQKEDS